MLCSPPLSCSSDDLANSQAVWQEVLSLNSELARLQSYIFNPTASSAYQVSINGSAISASPIHTLLKLSDTGIYTMFVINLDDVSINAQFTLPSRPVELYSIDANGARNPMTPYGNLIQDTLEKFGVRVYEFK